jgi:hypothetical protein
MPRSIGDSFEGKDRVYSARSKDDSRKAEQPRRIGASHHLKFVLVGDDFDYRIVFGTGQKPVGTVYGDINASTASSNVLNSRGEELFEFERRGRWTDSGATNAVSKEIIKRLLKLQNRHFEQCMTLSLAN